MSPNSQPSTAVVDSSSTVTDSIHTMNGRETTVHQQAYNSHSLNRVKPVSQSPEVATNSNNAIPSVASSNYPVVSQTPSLSSVQTTGNKSRLKRFIHRVKSGVKHPQQVPQQSNPLSVSGTIQQQTTSKNDVQNLQQRLASIMSNGCSLSQTTDASQKSSILNVQNLGKLTLSDLNEKLVAIRGSNSSVLTALSVLYQKASLQDADNIHKQMEEFKNKKVGVSGKEADSFNRIECEIYYQLQRIVYELNCSEIGPESSKVTKSDSYASDSSPILVQYAQALNIDELTRHVLYFKFLADKFEHTYYHLSSSLDTLKVILPLIQNQKIVRRDSSIFGIVESVGEAFIAKCRTKIIDLSFFFGQLSFSTSTNDYSEDRGLDCLDILLQCVNIVLTVKESIGCPSSMTLPQLLSNWVEMSIEKLFRINNEETYNLLTEKNQQKGIVFDGTIILYQCEFVIAGSTNLHTRFNSLLSKHLDTSFIQLVCKSLHDSLTKQIEKFVSQVDRHQIAEMKDKLKGSQAKAIDFKIPLALFQRMCQSINKAFSHFILYHQDLDSYPLHSRFYPIIQRCIAYQTSGRLQNMCWRAIENDMMTQPYEPSVLYTKSCVEVVNGCFELLGIVADIESLVHDRNQLNRSLLSDYFSVVHSVISIFLNHTSTQFRNILMSPNEENSLIRTMNDKIRAACSYFNNINGIFTLCKSRLTKFNNTTFMQIYMKKRSSQDSIDEDFEDDTLLDSFDNAPVDVFDLGGVQSLMTELQTTSNSIALFFAQFIFVNNEKKLHALFKHFDDNVLQDLLMSLDRFFMVTSEFLYIEQLHEVLKHLYVIYIQKLLDWVLAPRNSSTLSASLHAFIRGNSSEDVRCKVSSQCLKPLQELFYANGEGLAESFLSQHSRPLQIVISIFNDDTAVLIELYTKLTTLEPLLATVGAMDTIHSSTDTASDSISVASSDSSSSSLSSIVLMQMIQQQISNQQLSLNELIKPDYILVLLGNRRSDKEARSFVKSVVKHKR